MSSPQEPARRHHQKIRRSKQLAVWRDKNPQKELPGAGAAVKGEAKKAEAPKTAAAKPATKAAAKAAPKAAPSKPEASAKK